MQWTRGAALDRWARLGLAARVLKALSNASVFLLLLLPLVVLSNCGGTVAEFTGYQVLQETVGSIGARGWSEARRAKDKGMWTAVGCLATGLAILLGLGVLALAVLTIATGGCRC